MKRKIMVVMLCTGMSIGLMVGGASLAKAANGAKALAAATPSAETMSLNATTMSVGDFVRGKAFSTSLNGLEGNNEYAKLRGELRKLKSELKELESGTAEYNEKIAEINSVWGRISMIVGESNTDVAAFTQGLDAISRKNENDEFAELEVYSMIEYTEETA